MLAFKRRKGIGEWLTAYRCRFCNGFHFGHPPAHVREAIAHNQMERSFKGNHVTEVMARMRRERTKRAA